MSILEAPKTTDNTSWPQPPSFDRNAPLQFPKRFEPTYLMKKFRGERISSENVPAPFKIRSSGGVDIDLIAQNMKKQNATLSDINPYRLDIETDPFSPPTPSFFNDDKDNKYNDDDVDDKPLPRPCKVPKPKTEWSLLTNVEQKERYYDAKDEFVEYMSDTFPLRLEIEMENECDETWNRYLRCLNIKEQTWGGYRYSSLRAGMAQIYMCSSQHHEYGKCLDSVDQNFLETKLNDDDQRVLSKLFPR